jgi:hypothetical protein
MLKGLEQGGPSARQIGALWGQVRTLPGLANQRGSHDAAEFIVEAYTNSVFRKMLQTAPAPVGRRPLWVALTGIVRRSLACRMPGRTVPAKVMEVGPALLWENAGISPGASAPAMAERARRARLAAAPARKTVRRALAK